MCFRYAVVVAPVVVLKVSNIKYETAVDFEATFSYRCKSEGGAMQTVSL